MQRQHGECFCQNSFNCCHFWVRYIYCHFCRLPLNYSDVLLSVFYLQSISHKLGQKTFAQSVMQTCKGSVEKFSVKIHSFVVICELDIFTAISTDCHWVTRMSCYLSFIYRAFYTSWGRKLSHNLLLATSSKTLLRMYILSLECYCGSESLWH